MSSRSSSELIEACRAAAKRPVLERLRFYERLQPLDVGDVDELFGAVDPEHDIGWLPAAFAQLVPPIYWLTRRRGNQLEDNWLEDMVTWRLGDRWITILLAALTTGLPPLPILDRLRERLVRTPRLAELFEPAWQHITQLASHDNRDVRYTAAQLALLGKRITPAVTAAIGELLALVTDDVTDSYDDQVFGESLLIEIGRAGPLLSALSPRVERVLGSESPAFRACAAQAAGAIGDPRLVPVLEAIERVTAEGEFAIHAVRAMLRFALWQLTGDLTRLDRALDDASGSLVYSFRIFLALENAPVDERLLAGLAHIARKPSWHTYACNVLATIGRRGAATTAALPPPPDQHADTMYAFHHARWRAGLIDDAALVGALQPLLAAAYHAWKPYVETNLGTAHWRHTIQAAIGDDDSKAVLEALVATPAAGVQFVPELAAADRDDAVETLWSSLPRETFWAHAKP